RGIQRSHFCFAPWHRPPPVCPRDSFLRRKTAPAAHAHVSRLRQKIPWVATKWRLARERKPFRRHRSLAPREFPRGRPAEDDLLPCKWPIFVRASRVRGAGLRELQG